METIKQYLSRGGHIQQCAPGETKYLPERLTKREIIELNHNFPEPERLSNFNHPDITAMQLWRM